MILKINGIATEPTQEPVDGWFGTDELNPFSAIKDLMNPTGDENFGMTDALNSIGGFFSDIKHEGFWFAITGKHFGEWLITVAHDAFMFLINNNDVFLLLPAILFMIMTFMVGKNKYTKFIFPAWFFYGATEILALRLS